MTPSGRWVVAIDKFRGTATQAELSDVIADVGRAHGIQVEVYPTSDGGEGLLEALGDPRLGRGSHHRAVVTGPLGDPVEAVWLDDGAGTAVVESARASGLQLAGGIEKNDPWHATSRGTGELILAARAAGARRVLVGLGGSACTDGGRGALDVLVPASLDDPELGRSLEVCVDVRTRYLDSAVVFGPQKGAGPELVEQLTSRLRRERHRLIAEHALDPQDVQGSGAAGGLAGALACLGADVRPGIEVVAAATGLVDAVPGADLVVTGEGRFDASSLDGKVVGGVAALAAGEGVPVVAIVGDRDPRQPASFSVRSLADSYGHDRAMTDTLACVRAVSDELARKTTARRTPAGTAPGPANPA